MTQPITIGHKPAGSNRRVMVLAGAAVALILAVLVLPGLLFGGGDASTDLAFPPPSPGAVSVPTTPPTPGDSSATTEPALKTRNPFTPLVAAATAVAATSDGTRVVVGTAPVDQLPPPSDALALPVDGLPADAFAFPVDMGPDPALETDLAPPAPTQPNRVSLLEVFTDPAGQLVASVRVNDITYQVASGQAFAMAYRVVSLDGRARCAQLQSGDEQFGLCEGDELLK